MPHQVLILLAAGGLMFLVIGCLAALSHYYTLSGIKSKTVGDGQHGTARWATAKEIRQTYAHVPFEVKKWRSGQNLPTEQGLVLGCKGKKGELTALVDSDDIHCLMIGASGIGKTAYFLYPNLEYACASGMSWLALDSKGDLARNYGAIAKNCYGYQNVAVIDLRNPTRSDGNNLLTLVNRYMDIARSDPNNLAARAKAEKYAKILSKTIVNPDGDDSNRGQNAFFYDAAEGLLTSVILMLAEFLLPDKDHPQERRHIVSVFKLVQDLLEPSRVKGKSHFQLLMAKLPPDHKARWFAGAALNSAEQAMASVMSTVLSRLNAFLDSELEQILCFDSAIDAEKFASEKSAIFLILPEEDTTKNFMAGLMIQNLSRELFAVADENGGKLKNRVALFCDEFGTMPPFDILPLFSAGRSRRLTLVPIIQSLAQLEKKLRKRGLRDHSGQLPGHHLRRLCTQQPDRRSAVQSPGQPHRPLRLGEPGQERSQPEPADDGARPADARRAEIHSQGQLHCHENRHPSHADPAPALLKLGHYLRGAVCGAGESQPSGGLCQPGGSGAESPAAQ